MTYELHHLCTLFPRMQGAEFQALVDDIRANGLKHPIILRDNMILDGGNRYAACLKAGVKPIFSEYRGDNVVAYVLSQNLHRRHLTPGQQATIVAAAQDWAKAQARGGDRRSDQSQAVDFDSVEKRAAASGTSRVTQMKADKVAKADPALAKKVAQGEVSLPKAVAQVEAKEPKKQRKEKPKKAERPEPAAETAQTSQEEVGPSAEELAFLERKEQEFQQKLADLLETNEPLALATQRWKQAEMTIAGLQSRINGLLGEKAELIKEVKRWRNLAQRAA